VSEPYYSQRACSVCVSLSAFFICYGFHLVVETLSIFHHHDRIFVIIVITITKIYLFSPKAIFVFIVVDKKTLGVTSTENHFYT